MEEFNTLDKVKELFQKVNCIGQSNCYFVGYIDINSNAGLLGGALGGFVAGMTASMEYQCDGYLINKTEKGIGLIPLNAPGISKTLAKMKANLEAFIFIDQNDIQSVTIKKANLISLVSKSVSIKLVNGKKYNLIINIKEKNLPYHESNFSEFIDNYKK